MKFDYKRNNFRIFHKRNVLYIAIKILINITELIYQIHNMNKNNHSTTPKIVITAMFSRFT